MTDDELIVTLKDVRAAKLCMAGARDWFRRYELDWVQFRSHGYSASALLATGDEFAIRVVEVARGRK